MRVFNAFVTPKSEVDCNRLASIVHSHNMVTTDSEFNYDGNVWLPVIKPFKVGQTACFFINQYGKVYSAEAYGETIQNALPEEFLTLNELSDKLSK